MNGKELNAWVAETLGFDTPIVLWQPPAGLCAGAEWAATRDESRTYTTVERRAHAEDSHIITEDTGRGATPEDAILDLVWRLTGRTP